MMFENEWTGQFDRKGVKIMNGDRVKIPHFGEYESREFEYTVVFSDGAFRLKADYKPVIILDKVTAQACKVIKPKEEKDSKYSEAIRVVEGLLEANQIASSRKDYSQKIVCETQTALETAIEVLKKADTDEKIRADITKAAKKDKPKFKVWDKVRIEMLEPISDYDKFKHLGEDFSKDTKSISNFTELKERQKELYGRD